MNFYQAVFPEKKLFSKYSQKRLVLGYLPFIIYPFWSELGIKQYYLKSGLYIKFLPALSSHIYQLVSLFSSVSSLCLSYWYQHTTYLLVKNLVSLAIYRIPWNVESSVNSCKSSLKSVKENEFIDQMRKLTSWRYLWKYAQVLATVSTLKFLGITTTGGLLPV